MLLKSISEYRCGGSVGFSPTSQFNRHLT